MCELPLGNTFAGSVTTNHMDIEIARVSSKNFLQVQVEAY